MGQVIQKETDAYVHYEFSTVKCAECGVESNGFVHKEHLTADETIKYIQEISGFTVWSPSNFQSMGLTVRGKVKGGLLCPICLEEITKENE